MKKLIFLLALALVCVTGCQSKTKPASRPWSEVIKH